MTSLLLSLSLLAAFQSTSMSNELIHKRCIPCSGLLPRLKGEELSPFLAQLNDGWRVVNEHHLEKDFVFDDFKQALDFTNQLGAIAEHEGHHPDIYLAWGKVVVTIWTHKVDGLTESDFILAAKCDQIHSGT